MITEETDDGKISNDLINIRNGTILLAFAALFPVPFASESEFCPSISAGCGTSNELWIVRSSQLFTTSIILTES